MTRPELYFAHAMSDYGTLWEARAMEAILTRFPQYEVINPNRPDFDAACKREGFGFFTRRVQQCEAVVWSSFPDGWTGSGVAKEVREFIDRRRPVFHLTRGLDFIPAEHPRRVLSIDETRARVRRKPPSGPALPRIGRTCTAPPTLCGPARP